MPDGTTGTDGPMSLHLALVWLARQLAVTEPDSLKNWLIRLIWFAIAPAEGGVS